MLFQACQKDENTSLDSQLEDILVDLSDGQGLSFFTFPESNDLSRIPQDPKNPLTPEKVALGKLLYHETALGVHPKSGGTMGTYSCASCHHADAGFQAGVKQGIGEGGMGFGFAGESRIPNPTVSIDSIDVQPLRTPSALNGAYQTNLLWNGQFGATGVNIGTESQWTEGTPKAKNHLGFEGLETQAIAGLTVHRMDCPPDLVKSTDYKQLFDAAFPEVSEEERYELIYAGLAIGAYERTLLANRAPFQQWLKGNRNAMFSEEKEGAILFFGKGKCGDCHTGPALNKMEFHALGMDDLKGGGTFNVDPNDGAHLGRGSFTGNQDDNYKFKVPQLYNLKDSPFYGHGGSFTDLVEIVRYKNEARPENGNVSESQLAEDFKPLGLTDAEINKIALFMEQALRDPDLARYLPGSLPSGNCFPNNDIQSRRDLGCN